jgi:hypothetical protein
VVSNILQIPIHYYARIDFTGFKKIVDELGGVDIYVERSFTDYRFPTSYFGYTTISFSQGWQKMNGQRALEYVRSRYGNNGEGSDFARARRQQRFLLALKDKILTYQTLVNVKKINQLLNILGDHFRTNIEPWEMVRLFELAQKIDSQKIIRFGLSSSPGGLLKADYTPDGAYILIPRAGFGDFSEIQDLAQNIFYSAQIAQEAPKVKIISGISYPDYGKELKKFLEEKGFQVIKVVKSKQKITATQIYDYNAYQKPQSLKFLRDHLNCPLITPLTSFLDSLEKEKIELKPSYPSSNEEIDILIIIGEDFPLKFKK